MYLHFNKTKHKIPEPDITYVIKAVKSIINLIKKDDLVIIESTCPIGTTEEVAGLIQRFTGFSKSDISIAYCSEELLLDQL